MKVLIVTQYFWPETFGINRLALELAEQGIEVTVLTGKPNYPSGSILQGYSFFGTKKECLGSIRIFRVPLIPRGNRSAVGLILNYLSFVFFGSFLGPWVLRRRCFDVIFVYAPSPILQAIPAIFLSKLKRAPLVVWVQDLWPQSLSATGYLYNTSILWFVEKIVKYIYKSTDILLVQSKAFIATVRKQAGAEKPIIFFPNSAEVRGASGYGALLSPQSEKWISLIKQHFSIVFTGNIGAAQSMLTIINAASLCSSNPIIYFYIVGTGSESQWLISEIERRGLNNIFVTGWLPAEDMPYIWSASSALLVSLLDDPIFDQTIPNKLQFYLAAGKPIIACLGGEGARIVRESQAGLVCQPEDANALAECAINLAGMSETMLIDFGIQGKKYFSEHFDSKMLAKRLVIILTKLVNEGVALRT
jgi:glycosyltransferase involved in cell wall biosynthesis